MGATVAISDATFDNEVLNASEPLSGTRSATVLFVPQRVCAYTVE